MEAEKYGRKSLSVVRLGSTCNAEKADLLKSIGICSSRSDIDNTPVSFVILTGAGEEFATYGTNQTAQVHHVKRRTHAPSSWQRPRQVAKGHRRHTICLTGYVPDNPIRHGRRAGDRWPVRPISLPPLLSATTTRYDAVYKWLQRDIRS